MTVPYRYALVKSRIEEEICATDGVLRSFSRPREFQPFRTYKVRKCQVDFRTIWPARQKSVVGRGDGQVMEFAVGTFIPLVVGAADGAELLRALEGTIRTQAERIRRGEAILPVPAWADPPGRTVDVLIDADTKALLEGEAARQDVSLGRLLSHLAIVDLAERDRRGLPLGGI